jgi:outer membrane biosynthesis protein TonB
MKKISKNKKNKKTKQQNKTKQKTKNQKKQKTKNKKQKTRRQHLLLVLVLTLWSLSELSLTFKLEQVFFSSASEVPNKGERIHRDQKLGTSPE